MRTLRRTFLALILLGPAVAGADIVLRIPIVTQLQGVVFYRTSVTIGNGTGNGPVNIILRLTYRSAVDGTIQNATLNEGQILPYRVIFFEDIIQHFKDSGAIRPEDNAAFIFGTLLVTFDANDLNVNECIAEARTYSPAIGGGTNGIAYIGRDFERAGSEIIKTAVRNGTFGNDGTTRANIGFVNEGTTVTDVDVIYRDGSTGATLRQFTLTSLAVGEVVQLNNIFSHSAIPAGTRTIIVRAEASAERISGYAVQLDSVTSDGAFFLMGDSMPP
jgi:hypothetical protein